MNISLSTAERMRCPHKTRCMQCNDFFGSTDRVMKFGGVWHVRDDVNTFLHASCVVPFVKRVLSVGLKLTEFQEALNGSR